MPALYSLCGVRVGLHAALGANVLVESGTTVPRDGGPYVFTHRAMGDVPGLIVGWSSWGATIAGVAAAAVSFANFLAILVPSLAQREAGIAVALQLVLYGTNLLGLREGRVLQETTSFAKAALLLAFAIAAAFAIPAKASTLLPSPVAAVTLGQHCRRLPAHSRSICGMGRADLFRGGKPRACQQSSA